MKTYHDIYDRVVKRCLSLSSRTTILFINGIYGTDYALDSEVTYNWTEHADDDLKKTLADTIITINHEFSYHVEFEMDPDDSITVRIFEYGFRYALKKTGNGLVMRFPESMLIYLYEGKHLPDELTLTIQFGDKQEVFYRIPVLRYLDMSLEELEQKKLIILLPFQVLKLRKAIEKERTLQNMEALKTLVTHDILNTLNRSAEAGYLMVEEVRVLKRMILLLYHHIYDRYEEIESEGVNDAVEEALIFDVDIIEHEHKKQMKALEEEYEEKLRQSEAKAETEQRALKLLLKGMPVEEVSRETGLSPDDIKVLMAD